VTNHRHQFVLLLLPVAAALGACADRPEPRPPVNLAFNCQDGQSPVIRFFPDDRATIRLDDGRVVDGGQVGGGAAMGRGRGHVGAAAARV